MAEKTQQQLNQEERDKIKVESNTPPEKTADQIAAEAAAKEAEAKALADKEAEEKAKLDTEAAKKKEEETGEKEEELNLTEKDPEKLAKTIERLQKRIDKLTAQKKLTETEKAELANKLTEVEAAKGKTYTDEDIEKISETKANEKFIQREFIATCNRLADEAEKIDKKFKDKIDAVTKEITPIPGQMIGVLSELDNGGAVLNYLANDVDEYERVCFMTPGKMGIELTKLSAKVQKEAEEKAKKPDKEISKVPPVKEPIGGSAKTDGILRDDEPMDDWIRKRNEQADSFKKRKLAGMR